MSAGCDVVLIGDKRYVGKMRPLSWLPASRSRRTRRNAPKYEAERRGWDIPGESALDALAAGESIQLIRNRPIAAGSAAHDVAAVVADEDRIVTCASENAVCTARSAE